MELLTNTVQAYAWGSTTAIAAIRGETPPGGPQAELWVGAHPKAPSLVVRDGADRPLDAVVAADPVGELGSDAASRFGRFPFLLKILAAASPLSLQVHPSPAQARDGFAAETAAGVALDAPGRNYRDDWPKPEIAVALTTFRVLAGFRTIDDSLPVLRALAAAAAAGPRGGAGPAPDAAGAPATADPAAPAGATRDVSTTAADLLARLVEGLAGATDPTGALATAVRTVLEVPADRRAPVADAIGRAAAAALAASPAGVADRVVDRVADDLADDLRFAQELLGSFPEDPSVLCALLLNRIVLAPGEAVYNPAGTLHAYLEGTAVELMASSDNVLRGGLTAKHVDPAALLAVLDATPRPPAVVAAQDLAGHEWLYPTPTPWFSLSRLELADGARVQLAGPAGAAGVQLAAPPDAATKPSDPSPSPSSPSSTGAPGAVDGPELLLCVHGSATVSSSAGQVALRSGQAAYVRAGEGVVTAVGTPTATVFRARVGTEVDTGHDTGPDTGLDDATRS